MTKPEVIIFIYFSADDAQEDLYLNFEEEILDSSSQIEEAFNENDQLYDTSSNDTSSNDTTMESESSTSADDEDDDNDTNIPLYDESPISLRLFSTLLLIFSTKHCLADNTLADLLQLFQLVLPQQNCCPGTLYKFKRCVQINEGKHILHELCQNCHSSLVDACCVNENCDTDPIIKLQEKDKITYYSMDIVGQLKRIVSGTIIIYSRDYYIESALLDFHLDFH